MTALGPSADGKSILSCSSDMTLAAWDLTREWPSQPILGAQFAPNGNGLVVEAVDAGGPAWEAGLLPGDQVVRFGFGGKWLADDPAAWRERLADPTPGVEHAFEVRRGDQKVILTTTLKQRPLWRFLPAGGDEWVLWMWRNNFYDSSTKGDYSVGWHVNAPDPKDSPTFYRVEQFRRYFRRPDVINKLLTSGDPVQALGLLGANPTPLHFDDMEPPAATLTLGPTRPGQDVEATLSAFARGDNPDEVPVEAELWVNDHRLPLPQSDVQKWTKSGRPWTATATIPYGVLRAGDNVVTFLTWNRLGGRQDAAKKIVCDRPAPAAPRLIGLVVGVNNYKAAKPAPGKGVLGNLQFAVDDAQALSGALQEQKLYGATDLTLLLNDKEATRQAVLDALDALAKKGPAGRPVRRVPVGARRLPGGEAGERGAQSVFVFCPPDYDPTKPYTSGITNALLFEKMAAVPCRKLLLLDACRSGGAVAGDSPRAGSPRTARGRSSWRAATFTSRRWNIRCSATACSRGRSWTPSTIRGNSPITEASRSCSSATCSATRAGRCRSSWRRSTKKAAQVPILFAPGDEDFVVARGAAP